MLSQAIINGLTLGAVYSLLALGLTLLFSIMDILFFTHGALYMVAAYFVYHAVTTLGMNYFLAAIIVIAIIGLAGVVIEKGFFKPVRGKMLAVFFIAISLNWFMESLGFIVFGVRMRRIESIFGGSLSIGGKTIVWERVFVVAISLLAIFGLHLFLTKTKWGLQMRAFAEDREAAELQGISQDTVSSFGFFLGCSLAGLAGALIAPVYLITPIMGEHAVLNGMLIIAVGGLGSIPGALMAALVIGFIESFAASYIGADFTWGPIFIFAMTFLLLKPTGFLGEQR